MQCFIGPLKIVNTDSGNGKQPDGTKPLPEPMLTCFQLYPMAVT